MAIFSVMIADIFGGNIFVVLFYDRISFDIMSESFNDQFHLIND